MVTVEDRGGVGETQRYYKDDDVDLQTLVARERSEGVQKYDENYARHVAKAGASYKAGGAEDEYEDDLHPPVPDEEKMGFWRTGAVRAVKFYSAPFVKFGLDIVSYILLLSLYCYVLLHFRAGKCRLLTNRQISY